MHKPESMPARRLLTASLSVALGLSFASPPVAIAATPDGNVTPASDTPVFVDADRMRSAPPASLESDSDLGLMSSPVAHGLISGDLDRAAQRELLERLRAADDIDSDATLTATYVVTNCNDSGAGSLRGAIGLASAGDVIDMSNLGCSTITLDTYMPIVQSDLTIRGKSTFDEAQNKYSVSPTIVGAASNDLGLLVHIGGGELRLEKLAMHSGTKYDQQLSGGCASSNGDITLVEANVKYCTTEAIDAVEGGALHAAGDITLTRSQVYSSKAISSENAYGGAIYAGGRVAMTDSIVRNNEASSNGSGTGFAGGIFARGGALLRRVEIHDNVADIVGGMNVNDSNADAAAVYIKHALVHRNKSIGAGASGGVYVSTNGNVGLHNNTFTNNSSALDTGAGVRIFSGTVTMNSNLISGNTWDNNGVPFAADFYSSVAVMGSNNLVGWTSGPNQPPAGTIWQTWTPLVGNKPATGSWAFNRGRFLHDVVAMIPPPPGCVPNPPFELCLPLPIIEPAIDQAGNDRTVGAGTDIGALESDALFVDGLDTPPIY